MKRFNIDKLINIIIYFFNNTKPEKLSKTKILKLLFLSDFKHIEKYGRPILYDIYIHLPKGPVPTLTKDLLDNLKEEFDFDWGPVLEKLKSYFTIEKTNHLSKNYNYDIIIPKKDCEFDDMYFSESEIKILDSICKKYNNSSAKDLIKETHKHKGYKLTEENEEIDYRYGFKTKNDRDYYNFWQAEYKEFELAR